MIDILKGRARQGHDALFWRFAHGRAVRQGKWKLVKVDHDPWELYDIQADPVELNDLASKYPSKVAELAALWWNWHKTASGMSDQDKDKR